MAKQTKITIQTREVWLLHRPAGMPQGWCEKCGNWVELVTPDEAAQLTGVSVRGIFRQIEQAQLHFSETPAGSVRLCLPALIARISSGSATAQTEL